MYDDKEGFLLRVGQRSLGLPDPYWSLQQVARVNEQQALAWVALCIM